LNSESAIPTMLINSRTCRSPRGKKGAEVAVAAFVSIVSITVCEPLPGWIVADGAKESVAPVAPGGTATASEMGFGFD